jgi:hypothetical protein
MEILFRSQTHQERYSEILSQMKKQDCYHKALAYLFALDDNCYEHLDLLFDFEEDIIIGDGIHGGWHTSGSKRTVRLAFNLWNGFIDPDGVNYSTPSELFCGSFVEYYFVAIELRFEMI